LDIAEYSGWCGAETTLTTLLDHWTDDNDLNHQMVEMLLAQALLKIALSR
jgi:hypothetical protein